MRAEDIKIAVVGAGAVGGITAGFLKRAGCDVEVACKHDGLADKIRSGGLSISGRRGRCRIGVPAVTRISELGGPKDLVFLATKANDAMAAARELVPLLRDGSAVITMQNGMLEDDLAGILGPERIVGCVVNWGATMHSPGEIEMTAAGEFAIGYVKGAADARLYMLKDILKKIVPTEITDNIMGKKFYKLMFNSCFNPIGVISGLSMGGMFSRKKVRNIFSAISREAGAVAAGMGITPEPLSGKFDYYRLLHGNGPANELAQRAAAAVIGLRYGRLKSSSLQSLERGRPTEIEHLNAYISRKGRERRIPTPVNDKIVEMVREIESGARPVCCDNMDDPFFAEFG